MPVCHCGVRACAESDAEGRGIVRRKDGTSLLEARTYRFQAYSMYDAELYRGKQEVEEWKRRDPNTLLQSRLDEWGLCSVKDCAETEAAVAAEIEAAVAFPIWTRKGRRSRDRMN